MGSESNDSQMAACAGALSLDFFRWIDDVNLSCVLDTGSFSATSLGVSFGDTWPFKGLDRVRFSCTGGFIGIINDSGVCASCLETVNVLSFPRFSTRGDNLRTPCAGSLLVVGTPTTFPSCVGASVSDVTGGVRLSFAVPPFAWMLDDFPVVDSLHSELSVGSFPCGLASVLPLFLPSSVVCGPESLM